MTTDDTIDEDVQKLATECLRQMKKKNCIAPAFLAALIAEARASAISECKKEQDALLREFEKRLYAAKQEARADEWRNYSHDGCIMLKSEITEIKKEAYAKGQAELIEKIREDTKKYAKDTVWINDTMTLFDMLGIVDENASESAGDKKC